MHEDLPANDSVFLANDDLPHVKLDSDFAGPLCWSNSPGNLALSTYFNPAKPNLESDFSVDGLGSILREDHDPERFILTDKQRRCYVWDDWDGLLSWVRDVELETLETWEEKWTLSSADLVAWRWSQYTATSTLLTIRT